MRKIYILPVGLIILFFLYRGCSSMNDSARLGLYQREGGERFVQELKRLIKKYPKMAEPHYDLAEYYYSKGVYYEARNEYLEASRLLKENKYDKSKYGPMTEKIEQALRDIEITFNNSEQGLNKKP